MKLTRPQKNFLSKLDWYGPQSTNPATGNVAKALKNRDLVATVTIYSDGHHGDYRHIVGWKYGITNAGRQALRDAGVTLAHEADL